MPQGWDINPVTGDYKVTNGSPVQTNSLLLPSYYRLKVKRQRWLYAPDTDYGSDLFSIVKQVASTPTSLENIALRALRPLVDDGRASSIEVEVTKNVRHSNEMQVKVRDASGQVEVTTFSGLGS